MDLNIQYKIFSDNLLHKYLRENSNWYKILNRNPLMIDKMIEEMKDTYKLNTSDKIENIRDKLSLVESFIDVLK